MMTLQTTHTTNIVSLKIHPLEIAHYTINFIQNTPTYLLLPTQVYSQNLEIQPFKFYLPTKTMKHHPSNYTKTNKKKKRPKT